MKKSIRDRIAENERRAQIEAEQRAVALEEQERLAKQSRQSRGPGGVLQMTGTPGQRFPIEKKGMGSPTAVLEAGMDIGLSLRTGSKVSDRAAAFLNDSFEWTMEAEDAARLAAEGLPPVIICDRLGIDILAFEQWMLNTEFRFRIRQHLEALSEFVMTSGLANRTHRLKAANDRWNAQKQIVKARASKAATLPEEEQVPGQATGWLNQNLEYDVALSKEMRETEKQGAIEVGQWQEGAAPAQKIVVTYAEKQLILNAPVQNVQSSPSNEESE